MTSAQAGSILDDLPRKGVIDDSAMTVLEIMAHCCCGRIAAQKLIQQNTDCGKWEQVYKRKGCVLAKAYRRAV